MLYAARTELCFALLRGQPPNRLGKLENSTDVARAIPLWCQQAGPAGRRGALGSNALKKRMMHSAIGHPGDAGKGGSAAASSILEERGGGRKDTTVAAANRVGDGAGDGNAAASAQRTARHAAVPSPQALRHYSETCAYTWMTTLSWTTSWRATGGPPPGAPPGGGHPCIHIDDHLLA